MKKSITVSVEAEKLAALEMYLEQKNMKLSGELVKFSEASEKDEKHCSCGK